MLTALPQIILLLYGQNGSSSSSSSSFSSSSSSFSSSSFSSSSSSASPCPRQMGGNWQRKMWHAHPYFWRGREDLDNNRLIFEHIHEDDVGGDNWAENTNARISTVGFTGDTACFTVRGEDSGLPTTIHYSTGTDTYVAESDEASATGWVWQNTTKVFDGVADGGNYCESNLGADRRASATLWATAVFDDSVNIWLKASEQSASGDITSWDSPVDISSTGNTSTIYGESIRSLGVSGSRNMMCAWKEGDSLKSRLYTGSWKTEQIIDATAYSGDALFDFEHSEELGASRMNILYIDADGSVKWAERGAGVSDTWSAPVTLMAAMANQKGMGIVEHGNGLLYAIWACGVAETHFHFRQHRHSPEEWHPALGEDADTWDQSTEAVVTTTTVWQPQTPDSIDPEFPVIITWIGDTGVDACGVGFGLIEGHLVHIYTRDKRLALPTDDDDLAIAFTDPEYSDVETDDDVYVTQAARNVLDPYAVFLWKDQHTDDESVIIQQCIAKASIAPSTSPVYLQIFNQNLGAWETLDINNTGNADTEFTLSGTQATNVYAELDGDSQFFYRTDADFPEAGILGDLTIEAWVKLDSASTAYYIAGKWDFTGNNLMYLFYTTNSGQLSFSNTSDGTLGTLGTRNSTNLNLVADEWIHVAVVYDASAGACTFYKNGIALTDDGGALAVTIADKTPDWRIGTSGDEIVWFSGSLFNVALYNAIVPQVDILAAANDREYDHSAEPNIIADWLFDDEASAAFIVNGQGDVGRDLKPSDGGDVIFDTLRGTSLVSDYYDGDNYVACRVYQEVP